MDFSSLYRWTETPAELTGTTNSSRVCSPNGSLPAPLSPAVIPVGQRSPVSERRAVDERPYNNVLRVFFELSVHRHRSVNLGAAVRHHLPRFSDCLFDGQHVGDDGFGRFGFSGHVLFPSRAWKARRVTETEGQDNGIGPSLFRGSFPEVVRLLSSQMGQNAVTGSGVFPDESAALGARIKW